MCNLKKAQINEIFKAWLSQAPENTRFAFVQEVKSQKIIIQFSYPK